MKAKLKNTKIISQRLLLRAIDLSYKEDIFKEFTEAVTVYMWPKPPAIISDTEKFINDSIQKMEAGINLQLVILKKETSEFLGCLGLHKLDGGHPEFGIWLKKSAHGHKYGQEAVRTLFDWARINIDCEYFTYPVDKDNIASRKVVESIGGKIYREYTDTSAAGKTLNLLEYRIYKK